MSCVEVGEAQNGSTILARVGDSLVLRLAENRTTGFRWRLIARGAPVCRFLRELHQPPEHGSPGGSGLLRCEFAVESLGQAGIRLAYARSWSPVSGRSFSIDVQAKAE